MKPIYQTAFQPPDGDCVRACIASLLGLPLADVPHFTGERWEQAVQLWLSQEFGLGLVPVTFKPEQLAESAMGYHLMDGPSYSGDWNHMVVGWRGQIVHDPNPNPRPAALKTTDIYWLPIILDPERFARRWRNEVEAQRP